MTVSAQATRNVSTAAAGATTFPYNFKIVDKTHLLVTVNGVVKTVDVDYTVSNVGNNSGGDVVFTAPLSGGQEVIRKRDMPFERLTDYQHLGDLRSPTLNNDQDAPVMMIQQLAGEAEVLGDRVEVVEDVLGDLGTLRASVGYFGPVPYASGLSITSPWQTVDYMGTIYAPIPSAVPFTTGAWNPAQWRVIQGVTAGDLASASGAGMVGFQQAGAGAVVRPLQDKMRERISVLDFIPVEEHAAIRDYTSTFDCTQYIQKAIDQCMYLGRVGNLHVPSGLYNLSNSLFLGYGDTFRSITLFGDHSGYRGEANFRQTAFKTTFSDRPVFAVQGARRVRVRSISCIGPNHTYLGTNAFGGTGTPSVDDTVLANWIDPSLHANANSRYAPCCAVAIDPYSGAAPTPSYPSVSYPAFLGAINQYNKPFSVDVVFDDCFFSGFVVGAVLQPGDSDGDGAYISFRDTTFERMAYAVSVGQSQSRNVNFENCQFNDLHTVFTNKVHGRQLGKFGGKCSGSSFLRVIRIFDMTMQTSGPMELAGCYGELVWQIGKFGPDGGISYPICIADSELHFVDAPVKRGIPNKLIDGNVNLQFRGGSLHLDSINSVPSYATFDGTMVYGKDVSTGSPSAARKTAQSYSGGVTPFGGGLRTCAPASLIGVIAGGAPTIHTRNNILGGRANPFNRSVITGQWTDIHSSLAAGVPRPVVAGISKGSVTTTFSGAQGTMDFTGASAYLNYKIQAGDYITDDQTGTIFLITSVTGLLATVVALNNYYQPSGTGSTHDPASSVFRVAVSTSTGSWFVACTRIYGTAYPLFGDITSGSAVISNVGRGDSWAGFIPASLSVGDYLYQNEQLGKFFPIGVTVSSWDTTARTITMSANATKSSTAAPLHFWVKA